MNRRMILYLFGVLMRLEAALMLPPMAVSLLYGEQDWKAFAAVAIPLAILGFCLRRPRDQIIYSREGFVIVALAWVLMSAVGALPFVISGAISSYVDAFFETVSGFTTTGATILTDIEALGYGMLFWRSFTHWIGGMGVLVFIMAILPLSSSRAMHLMRAEVPGPTVSKLVPKTRSTAKLLYGIYIVMTGIEIVFLLCGGMPLYDSILISMSTAGTGGFANHNASIAAYNSAYIDVVVSVFMILFGINFNLFYLLLVRRAKEILHSEELWVYLVIITAATVLIGCNILHLYGSVAQSLRYAFFQVSSIITTTGFMAADFNQWPELSKMTLVLLMFLGANAGSTGGGLKTARLIITAKAGYRELFRLAHPKAIRVVRLDGRTVDEETVSGVGTFLQVYFLLMCLSFLLISLDGYDFTTTITSVITCINNVGPGLNLVGPAENFSFFSPFAKLILSLDMLLGRLEIFPILMLFAPSVWRSK